MALGCFNLRSLGKLYMHIANAVTMRNTCKHVKQSADCVLLVHAGVPNFLRA